MGSTNDGAATVNQLLTAADVAKRLNVHKTTVYAWAAQGNLPCIVLAQGIRKKCMRFDSAELERWIQEQRVDSVIGR